MEKHKQDSEVKMTIRFEEKVSTENAQLVCKWSNSLASLRFDSDSLAGAQSLSLSLLQGSLSCLVCPL